MNINAVLFLILIAVSGRCIDINLPVHPEFEDLFESDEVHVNYPLCEEVYGVTCYDKFYEGKNELITRVLYKGFELFYDREKRGNQFRRIVTYSHVNGRTYITVYKQYHISTYEAVFYVANGHVYDLLRIKQLINNEEYLICGKTPGRFISKMFRWLPREQVAEDEASTSTCSEPTSEDISESTNEPTSEAKPTPSTTSSVQFYVKRKYIELDIDIIFERRLIGRFGIYTTRKREKSKRSLQRKQLKLSRRKSDTDSD